MAGKSRPKVLWSLAAEEDLISIWMYVARQSSVNVADDQLRAISRACEAIGEWPLAGRARDKIVAGLRSIPASPHVFFFRPNSGGVEILRVLHERRDLDTMFSASA
jgi:toxin ParE1/3/4